MNNDSGTIRCCVKLFQRPKGRFFYNITVEIEDAAMRTAEYLFVCSSKPNPLMRAAQVQCFVGCGIFLNQQNIIFQCFTSYHQMINLR